jgi:ribonuclease D
MSESESETTRIDLPRDGLPDLIDSARGLQRAAQKLADGHGPVAIDAERASGFRFSQRAYLVQLRRAGSGTFLIDPIEFVDLAEIQKAIEDVDWILHAASQDLICLAEVGLQPKTNLFDTEVAGRLLGLPKVGLGTLTESHLGISLAKEHSAADWSTRPLPDEWLAYAALDVEFLIELWDLLSAQLEQEAKMPWAIQEFEHIKNNTFPSTKPDPWRKTSGIHKLKDARQLGIAQQLWEARLEIAKQTDIASGRILNDAHIVEISSSPDWESALKLPFMKLRGVRKYLDTWSLAFQQGMALPDQQLPDLKLKHEGPPNARNWQSRHPDAWAKLEATKLEIGKKAEELKLPVENLITPEVIRRVIWAKPNNLEDISLIFEEFRVRPWQQEFVQPILRQVLEIS